MFVNDYCINVHATKKTLKQMCIYRKYNLLQYINRMNPLQKKTSKSVKKNEIETHRNKKVKW